MKKKLNADNELNSVNEQNINSQREGQKLQCKKNFDKSIIFRNIRELLKKSKLKIGQIEKEAGCQPGYMSRLEKPGNTSDPSVEFVLSAAKLLEVPVDLLIFGHMQEITDTEKTILQFIAGLTEDTRADKLDWKREIPEEIKNKVFNSTQYETLHSFFLLTNSEDNSQSVKYNSRFSLKDPVWLGNCFHAQLPEFEGQVYLMRCLSRMGHSSQDQIFFEIYLEQFQDNGPNSVMPICCSLQTCELITRSIDTLYKEIELTSSHIHIEANAREIINNYLQNRKGILPA